MPRVTFWNDFHPRLFSKGFWPESQPYKNKGGDLEGKNIPLINRSIREGEKSNNRQTISAIFSSGELPLVTQQDPKERGTSILRKRTVH